MEIPRDLGQVELWQESLERSLARRGKLTRSSVELQRLRPARDLGLGDVARESAAYWRQRRRAEERHLRAPVLGAGGASALALLAVTVPNVLGARGSGRVRAAALVADAGIGGAPHASPRPQPVAPATPSTRAPSISRPAPASVPRSATKPVTPAVSLRRRSSPGIAPAPRQHPVIAHPAVVHAALASAHAAADTPAHAAAAAPARSTVSGGAGLGNASRTTATTHGASHPSRRAARHSHHPAPKPIATHKPKPAVSGGSGLSSGAAPAAPAAGGYVNPLAHAQLTPERIDQGVDYAGSGSLTALGPGRVTYVATTGTGWPGAFIEYRLTGGPDTGRYVYYAEGIVPAAGLHIGQSVRAGQALAQIVAGSSTGIEIGWAAGIGTETYAASTEGWNGSSDAASLASAAGRSFSALIASLGGPPGKVEG